MVIDLIVKRYRELYVVSICTGIAILIALLSVNAWDIYSLISADYMVTLIFASRVTMNAFSGIGLMLTYASVCTLVFKSFSDGMKGDRSRARRVKLVLLLPIIGIAAYGAYKMLWAFSPGQGSTIEALVSIYGVLSFSLSVYIIPIARGSYQPEFTESTADKVQKRFSDAKYSLWSGYQTRIRRDYGKAFSKEYERYGVRLNTLRGQLSGVLLLPLGLSLVVFPPLAVPIVVLWLRSFTLDRRALTLFERALLITSILSVMLLSILTVLVGLSSTLEPVSNIVYGLGILVSIIVLAYIMVSS